MDFAPAESRVCACAQAAGNPWLRRSAQMGACDRSSVRSQPFCVRCQDDRVGPRGLRGRTAPARRCSPQHQGFPVPRKSRGGNTAPSAHASTPAGPPARGPGNPHPPQCALGAGRGNRLKPEWGSPRRWRGKEREQGLPEVPAPAFAVALATRRAGRSEGAAAAVASGKPAALRLRRAPLL